MSVYLFKIYQVHISLSNHMHQEKGQLMGSAGAGVSMGERL